MLKPYIVPVKSTYKPYNACLASVNCYNCRIILIYANGRKRLDLNKLPPSGLLLGVSLAWSCCQKLCNN